MKRRMVASSINCDPNAWNGVRNGAKSYTTGSGASSSTNSSCSSSSSSTNNSGRSALHAKVGGSSTTTASAPIDVEAASTPIVVETKKKSVVKNMYQTLTSTFLCGAPAVIVRSPTPDQLMFQFTDEDSFKAKLADGTLSVDRSVSADAYTVDDDDIGTEELVFGRIKERNNKSRLNKFVGGRVALRRALKAISRGDSPSILKDAHGAPVLPGDVTGSISHKDDLAVGVAIADSSGGIGVDIERCHNKAAFTLLRRIITPREQANLGSLPGISVEEEVLLRFSFKEAVYKAMHPFLERSVDFSEVEIEPLTDGTAKINFLLKTGEEFRYRASWQRYNELYWLTCVYLLGDEL